jgi:hypothetical protein
VSPIAGNTRTAIALLGFAAAAGLLAGCRAKATPSQCDQLLDRYATLVVTEKYGQDASAEQIVKLQQYEKSEARSDDAFKNCSSEVSQREFGCAMNAPTADAFEKCLE